MLNVVPFYLSLSVCFSLSLCVSLAVFFRDSWQVIHENLGIAHGCITTIHNVTGTQPIIDMAMTKKKVGVGKGGGRVGKGVGVGVVRCGARSVLVLHSARKWRDRSSHVRGVRERQFVART